MGQDKETRGEGEPDRIRKQFDFIREIDKEKFIGRQTYLTDGNRKENDAEHAAYGDHDLSSGRIFQRRN